MEQSANEGPSSPPAVEPAPASGGSVDVRAPHPVYWIIAAALVVIAVSLVFRGEQSPGQVAFAQPTTSGGLRGVYSFAAELSKGNHGVYMVDVDTMTIWCYEYSREKGCLRLAAARSWKYDRYLENYNVCDIPPEVVEKMVEDQRAYKIKSGLKPGP